MVDRTIEARAERFLARVPGYVWDGESLPVPVAEIADSFAGLLVRDVEDLRGAPGALGPVAHRSRRDLGERRGGPAVASAATVHDRA